MIILCPPEAGAAVIVTGSGVPSLHNPQAPRNPRGLRNPDLGQELGLGHGMPFPRKVQGLGSVVLVIADAGLVKHDLRIDPRPASPPVRPGGEPFQGFSGTLQWE